MASPPRFLFIYKLSHSSPTKGRGILREFAKAHFERGFNMNTKKDVILRWHNFLANLFEAGGVLP